MINLKRLVKSFNYALEGILYTLKTDQNLIIHFSVAILVIIASIFFRVNPFELGLVFIMILLVISAEMINTAMEKMVDLITKEHRVEAKIAKDVSSGMVLLTVAGAIIVGILIFTPYLIKYFHL